MARVRSWWELRLPYRIEPPESDELTHSGQLARREAVLFGSYREIRALRHYILQAVTVGAALSALSLGALGASTAVENNNSTIVAGYAPMEGDVLASNILGASVYSSTSADAEHFGEITDLILDANGDVQAVVIGVGGVLGLGKKSVAIDYLQLKAAKGADGENRYVLRATKDALASAPDFVFPTIPTTLPSTTGTALPAAK